MADKNTTSNINLAAAEELPKAQSKFKEFVKKFMKRKTAVISLAFIVFIILMAIIGPYVVPYDPQAPDYTAMMQGPSAAHIWGTNEYGQDVFSRLMVGTRLSLTCALTATIIGTAIGVVLGLIAGFYGGIIDSLIMRCCAGYRSCCHHRTGYGKRYDRSCGIYSAVLRTNHTKRDDFRKAGSLCRGCPFPGMFKHKNPVCTYFPWYDPVYDR